MPYKPTEKILCKECFGWVAEVDARTRAIVRHRHRHNYRYGSHPASERPLTLRQTFPAMTADDLADLRETLEAEGLRADEIDNEIAMHLPPGEPRFCEAYCQKCRTWTAWGLRGFRTPDET